MAVLSDRMSLSLAITALSLGGFLQSFQLNMYIQSADIPIVPETTASSSNSTAPSRQQELNPIQQRQGESYLQLPSHNITIFYNVFLPTNATYERLNKAKSVIVEQMKQLATSHIVTTLNSGTNNVELQFVSIGHQETGPMVLKECQKHRLHCIHLSHEATGYEDQTLRHIYPFCEARVNENSYQHQIIYLHSKGSFHIDGEVLGQDNWRRAMTDAVTGRLCEQGLFCNENSQHCDSSQEQTQCNVCGLLFQPLPHHHFTGNMFTTTCGYILQGLNYHETEYRLRNALDKLRLEGHYRTSLFRPRQYVYGSGRYMAEYWIGNTPYLRPCDVAYRHNSIDYWKSPHHHALAEQAFRLSSAPSVPMAARTWDYHRYTRDRPIVNKNQSERLKNFFLLPGNLFKWKTMYNQTPPKDSWVWSWYPDGPTLYEQTFGGQE